jgi:hypothetical protein
LFEARVCAVVDDPAVDALGMQAQMDRKRQENENGGSLHMAV